MSSAARLPAERPAGDPWWQTALDYVLPPRCVACGRRGAEICPACIEGLRPLGPATCPRCSVPSLGGRICPRCVSRPSPLKAVVARYAFEGGVRAAILAFKYRGRTRLARFLTSLLADALAARPISADLVLPVPLSSARLRERGFNQAELLARPLAVAHGWPFDPTLLVRTRETLQQTQLPAADRLRNVAGAIEVADTSNLAGKRVLLVDDVCTTGATLTACALPLIAAGASGVWGIVVARDMRTGRRSNPSAF